MRDASCGTSSALTEHRRDVAPSVDTPQADLPADDEPEEQAERRILGGQAGLRLHATPNLLVQPLNHVRGLQGLPLAEGRGPR